jgi:hypothetical protein
MTFEEILDQAIAMLQRRKRLTYSTALGKLQCKTVQNREALRPALKPPKPAHTNGHQ